MNEKLIDELSRINAIEDLLADLAFEADCLFSGKDEVTLSGDEDKAPFLKSGARHAIMKIRRKVQDHKESKPLK